jgi:asparagine synthase (glutamine-hydrolysing)
MVQAQHPGTSYKSFSIYYDGTGDVDERSFIYEVINKYPSIEPFYKQPSEDEITSEFHRALFHADVPSTGSSFISQYFLMKLIADNGIKVVLDGQGSDEYLGGYLHTFYRLIGGYLRQGRFLNALSITQKLSDKLSLSFPKTLTHFSKSLLCSISSEQKLYDYEYRNYFPFLLDGKQVNSNFSLENKAGSSMDRFLYHLLFTTSLPSLLHYEDRNSMAFSIESRVPFLDHRLVEYAFSLKDEDKIRGVETKYILRKALAGILPDAITNRQDKKGFVTPGENKWLKGPLKHLLEIDFSNLSFLNKKLVTSLVDQYKKGDSSNSVLVWRIATLNYWMKYLQ